MTFNTEAFASWRKNQVARIEQALQAALPAASLAPQSLHEAMRYGVLNGGKRLRALLALAAAELGCPCEVALNQAVVALECIHAYSLVHDDMPEMDNDTLRRGQPTCHVVFGAAGALLAGDALQTLAFDVMSKQSSLPAARQLRMVQTLARCAGSLGMAGGQAIDLASTGQTLTQPELEVMHQLKTGALIRSAVLLGALTCMDVTDESLARLETYALHVGLAFQVIDDVLDCEQETRVLGKTAGKDHEAQKSTYVKLMSSDAAREYAECLALQALAAIEPFGGKANHLAGLVHAMVRRDY